MDDLRQEFRRRKNHADTMQVPPRPNTSGTCGRPRTGGFPGLTRGNNFSRATASSCSSRHSKRDEVLEVLVSSEDLLAFLFEKLFPHRSAFFFTKTRESMNAGLACRLNATKDDDAANQALPPMPSFDHMEQKSVKMTSLVQESLGRIFEKDQTSMQR